MFLNTRGKIVAIFISVILIALGYFLYIHFSTPAQPSLGSMTETPAQTASSTSSTTTEPVKSAAPVTQPSLPVVKSPATTTTPLPAGTDQFTIELDATTSDAIAANLQTGQYIQSADTFINAAKGKNFTAGAYKISKDMNVSQLVTVLSGKPYMVWVLIPEGLRKEEIADLLKKKLNWSTSERSAFLAATTAKSDYTEGVYFPDTYLIPVDETPADVTNRLIAKFNEKFAPFLPQFNAQNIKWTTGLTLASIVQREAANDADTALIAGILWNRLEQGMALDVDATLQYARGDVGNGYWAPITTAEKKIDSPYNTYINKGLPPHPISNPGIPAIAAVLNPASTTCLYYLHDKNHVTHCADTYEEHQANIQKYLIDTDN